MSNAEKQLDPLEMADDEFSNVNLETMFDYSIDEDEDQDNEEESAVSGDTEETDSVENEETEATDESEESEEESSESEQDLETSESELLDEDSSESEEDSSDSEEDKEEEEDPNMKAMSFMEKITAPFKANGQEMKIDNPDDVIRLMQMGANYNKKMAALKPALKVTKMLERNNLLDEEKLSFLIDLDKKDPTAIAKLLKDSKLDPMDLDLEEGDKYKTSKKYSVDEKELALDSVIEDIRETPTYSKTLDIVSNKWDDQSRNIVANTPELLRVINDHIGSGIYDIISTEVAKERTLGRLNGVSDIDAYHQTGDAINARGGFDHLNKQGQTNTPKKVNPAPKKTISPENRQAKRRAASPSKPAPTTASVKDFNPLALSDDEFMKQFDDRFL